MAYEPLFEKFEVTNGRGQVRAVAFKKAGRLAAGDQPELYFFEVDGRPVVVGISGEALERWQHSHWFLSREEKIDVAGLWLKRGIEAGGTLVAEHLYLGELELGEMIRTLGFGA
jgi:hypothetical protein